MKTTLKWSMTTLLAVGALALVSCGGGGGGGSTNTTADNSCAGNSDTFICQVYRIVGLGSETAEPASIDAFNATSPETNEPSTNI